MLRQTRQQVHGWRALQIWSTTSSQNPRTRLSTRVFSKARVTGCLLARKGLLSCVLSTQSPGSSPGIHTIIVLTRLLEAAHGGRYDWDTQADVLARPAKARKVAGREEKVDCGVHFEATNVGMVLLQQPSVLSMWWAPSEARHKLGLANRSSAFHD